MAGHEWVCFLTLVTCRLLQDGAGGMLLSSLGGQGVLHGLWTQALSPQAQLAAEGCRKAGGFLCSLLEALDWPEGLPSSS